MSEFFEQIFCKHCKDYSVIIEDDGRVCYAYLYFNSNVIGDVWMYNQSPSPIKTEWIKDQMPFLNPIEFTKEGITAKPITKTDEFKISCIFYDNTSSLKEIRLIVRDEHIATLRPGSKPGWSKYVKKDGPLALILNKD